ncbi:type VI secretion system baseplate subunit TssG [Enterobacter cloacae]|uniref:type VI secretion system baseplate subunit TssG n=1 Tax=Enterobacter cloacae TaxID=550 RepID=UPI00101B05C0|nr:type VI secretion system baseplate subunit TssG [Enterobacter cloacae]QBC03355.1 type VI secretion system baseplate subunit TssG [Enterobacter cloacae]
MSGAVDPLAALRREPWRYDFFSALRLIELAYPQAPPLGSAGRLRDDPVRLGQHLSLAFEPAMVKRLSATPQGLALLEVTFFGLTGPHAPMPLHLSEEALGRKINQQDPSLGHFLDIFHHRLLTLLYRSWAQARQGSCLENYLAALSGGAVEYELAGEFAEQRRSAQGLRRMLRRVFSLSAEVTPLVHNWLPLAAEDQARLGHCRFDNGIVLGKRVCNTQQYFRLRLQPTDFAAYQRCLPSHPQFAALIHLIRRYVGEAMQWTLTVQLPTPQRPALRLGKGLLLGRETWLGPAGSAPRQDYTFNPARFYP